MLAFISGRIDHCSGLLSGLPERNITSFQLLQNPAARVLLRTRRQARITGAKIPPLAPRVFQP